MSLRPQDDSDVKIYQGICFNHICNILLGAVEVMLGKRPEVYLKYGFEPISRHLHIACYLGNLLIQVNKEYNFKSNYEKGRGDESLIEKTDVDLESYISLSFELLKETIKIVLLRGHCQYMMGWMICRLLLRNVCRQGRICYRILCFLL